MPALLLKMISAIFLGLLYKFYYVNQGGDTFGYYYGAKKIWTYFNSDPISAFRVIFWNGDYGDGMFKLVSKIPNHLDSASFAVDRTAGFIGLFTFGNYSGIALVFALISFSGSWALFTSLRRIYPQISKYLAITTLFIPSVVFWGSGILKDTLTLSAMCWMIWAFINVVYFNQKKAVSVAIFFITAIVIYSIKSYILVVLIPSLLLWYYRIHIKRIRIVSIRYILNFSIILVMIFAGYRIAPSVMAEESKYSIDSVINTVSITAHDIRYWTGSGAGSGYDLGKIPETWQDMIRLFPQAVNVSLFRPYLWEVSNPLMLLMALESMAFLAMVLYLFVKYRFRIFSTIQIDPFLVFAFVFVIGFAYAVGISTWNFGTLLRYKVPLMPLFASGLLILFFSLKGRRVKNV